MSSLNGQKLLKAINHHQHLFNIYFFRKFLLLISNHKKYNASNYTKKTSTCNEIFLQRCLTQSRHYGTMVCTWSLYVCIILLVHVFFVVIHKKSQFPYFYSSKVFLSSFITSNDVKRFQHKSCSCMYSCYHVVQVICQYFM